MLAGLQTRGNDIMAGERESVCVCVLLTVGIFEAGGPIRIIDTSSCTCSRDPLADPITCPTECPDYNRYRNVVPTSQVSYPLARYTFQMGCGRSREGRRKSRGLERDLLVSPSVCPSRGQVAGFRQKVGRLLLCLLDSCDLLY